MSPLWTRTARIWTLNSFERWMPLLTFPPSCILQHDGKPYCHKPCYAALFGPKGVISFLLLFFLCLHFSISSTLVVYNVCMCFRREHRRCRFLCVRQSCQRSPCCCFYGNRWQTRGGEESPRTGTSEGWEICINRKAVICWKEKFTVCLRWLWFSCMIILLK